jgi:hypothetical protein
MPDKIAKQRKNPDHRYITLDGYPLHRPLWKTFHQAAAVRLPVTALALAIGAEWFTHGGAHAVNFALHNAPELLVFSTFSYFSQNIMLFSEFRSKAKKLCIDTVPNSFTPPTSTENLEKATALAQSAHIWPPLLTAFPTFIYTLGNLGGAHLPFSFASGLTASLALPWVACSCSLALRFSRVAKGEYAIIDAPPKPAKRSAPAGLLSRIGLQLA